jgi:hypothetical protein
VARLDPAFLVPDVASPFDASRPLVRNPFATLRRVGAGYSTTVHVGELGPSRTFTVAAGEDALVEWLSARTGAFTLDEAAAAHPALARAAVAHLVAALQATGFLVAQPASASSQRCRNSPTRAT